MTSRLKDFNAETPCETPTGCAELLGYARLASRSVDMDDITFMESFFAMCSRFPQVADMVYEFKQRINWGYMWRRC